MSFFPGVVVVLNILLMLTDNNKRATMATMGMTVGLTVAVMVHLCIVAMFNDQVMQRRSLYFQAELEQQRASALLDSYTAQRRLTHEFTNHISALQRVPSALFCAKKDCSTWVLPSIAVLFVYSTLSVIAALCRFPQRKTLTL